MTSPLRPRPPRRGGARFALRPTHLALLLALILGGCAARGEPLVRPAPASLPEGSPLRDPELGDEHAWVRHHLMFGEFDRALRVLRESPAAPSDRLVRALQEGVVLHRSGEHERSNEVLEWAEREADRRYTRSVSRAAASLLMNDAILAYTPTAGEMVMIPYYRMLNYGALGDLEGALVEARKANAFLARLARGDAERCQEDALVQYLAGLVQRAGGEENDALVSLRLAERGLAGCGEGARKAAAATVAADLARLARATGMHEAADSLALRYSLGGDETPRPASADVVILLEHGFVAHRAERALHVPIFPEEIEGLEGGDGDGITAAAARITERMLHGEWERAAWGRSWNDRPYVQLASALDGAYLLRLAWPVVRREEAPRAQVRVWVGDSLAAALPVGDLSSVVQRELEAQRPAMLGRLVARGLAKYLVTREMEKKAEDESGELAGFLVGRLANLAANELERADTRSWSLLPDRISLVRASVPPGEHGIRIETLSAAGEVISVRELEPVSLAPGGLALLSERVWGGGGRVAQVP